MKARRKKKPMPIMLLWSKQEQRRFTDSVERLVSAIGDAEILVREPAARARDAAATRAARLQAPPATNGQELEAAVVEEVLMRITGLSWMEVFDLCWAGMAVEGMCDAPGGAEWARVKQEWKEAGKPQLVPFIRLRANIGPNG